MTFRPNYDDPRVREGCLLRIASDLLVPFGELGELDRFELVEWLARLGMKPATATSQTGWFWVEGACPGPEPKDEVTILRSEGDWWVIGIWERGSFRVDHRFGREGDACRWLLHDLVAARTTSMGTTQTPPHVRDRSRSELLAVLAEVAALVNRGADVEREPS